jgi:broad specificity phosphatase PhoE/ribonuclease HI
MARELVVEADGGSRGNPGPAGYGALVRDAKTGELLREIAESIGIATNNVAEYRGLIAGLRAAHEIDPTASIAVHMDSKLVVEQMSGRWQIKHPDMRLLAREALDIHERSLVTFGWVPREQNSHADRLANEALDAAEVGQGWFESTGVVPPESVEAPATVNRLAGRLATQSANTTIFLIRHGETAFTPERRFSGWGSSDPSLSEHGHWQARAVAEALSWHGIDTIISSPAARTLETAKEISNLSNVGIVVNEDFRECSFGEWDGLTFAEVEAKDSRTLDNWLASPAVAPPGGESFNAVGERVMRGFNQVLNDNQGEKIAIVCHVTPIKQIIRHLLDAPSHALHRMDVHPCSISVIASWPDGLSIVRGFNEIAHLRSR